MPKKMSEKAGKNNLAMLFPRFPLDPPRMRFFRGLTIIGNWFILELAIESGGGRSPGGAKKVLLSRCLEDSREAFFQALFL